MIKFEKELDVIPKKPGVYLMYDSNNKIIYIGKAKNLFNRIRQYFRESTKHSIKIENMVKNVNRFEYILTDSEIEALILECNLIKEHSPKYNTMLKDDKTYPYLKATVYEEYPKILFTRNIKKDNSKYFGPYPDVNSLKLVLEIIRDLFKIRTCNRNLPKDIKKERPCLYYDINKCSGPCFDYISKEEYNLEFNKALSFLNGKDDYVIKTLEKQMLEYSDKLKFEDAAIIRDKINSLKILKDKQKMSLDNSDDKDYIAISKENLIIVVVIFLFRNNKLITREKYNLTCNTEDDIENLLTDFVKQHYILATNFPKQIYLSENIYDKSLIEQYLSDKKGSKVHIYTPKNGINHNMIKLAKQNADMIISNEKNKKIIKNNILNSINNLAKKLNISKIDRIESYDISNTSGTLSVGSMVVFKNGIFQKNLYRKFKIKTIEGANDYASMKEIITRRFNYLITNEKNDISFEETPSLLLIDGGQNHINIVKQVLIELAIDIPVCGMIKDDKHRTKDLIYNNKNLNLKKDDDIFKLITQIQDETHRFAISYHKKLRGNNQIKSILDNINGVGEKRKKDLLTHFKNIDNIKNASLEELEEVVNKKTANEIYQYFKRNIDI